MLQTPKQPAKIIDELEEGEKMFKCFLMVVGKELCSLDWKPEKGKLYRPPGYLKLRDRNDKYIMMTIWANLWKGIAPTDQQQADFANRFMCSFLFGATYEFSFLNSRELVRNE